MTKVRENLERDPKIFETPCYVYDVDRVIQNFQELKASLGTNLIVSLKANSCVELLIRCNHVITDGTEVASLQELNTVVGGTGGDIYLNSPAYEGTLIRAALASRATLILDNLAQLEQIQPFVGRAQIKPVILRLNSVVLREFDPDHPKVREDQFGFDWAGAQAAIARLKAMEIPVQGFHIFKGSYTFQKTAVASLKAVRAIQAAFEAETGEPVTFINLGGGFGENWRADAIDFDGYRKELSLFPAQTKLAHESGRGLFGDAGAFLTRVIYTKEIDGQRIAVCDGGIAHAFLLAGTENTFRKWKVPTVIKADGSDPKPAGRTTLLVGPSCSKDDQFSRIPQDGPLLEAGDLCVFAETGAYHYSYSVQKFLSLPEAKQYVV